MRELAKIVLLAVASAVLYGEVQDQVTAHLCVEYFSVAHPHVVDTTSPAVLALVWGVLATWWVGVALGALLAAAARLGSRPPLAWRDLVPDVVRLLAVLAVAATAAGVVGWLSWNTRGMHLAGPLAWQIPRERHALFYADAFAHVAAYGVGFVGGLVLCVRTWRRRRPVTEHPPSPESVRARRLLVVGVLGIPALALAMGAVSFARFGLALAESDLRASLSFELAALLSDLHDERPGARPADAAAAYEALTRPYALRDGRQHPPLLDPTRSWCLVREDPLVILDPWGTPLRYEPGPGKMRLWSCGPDGVDQDGKGDDVLPRE